MSEPKVASQEEGVLSGVFSEIISSPINMILVVAIFFLIYKIIRLRFEGPSDTAEPMPPPLPKMKKQDMTLEQLRKYDGIHPEGNGRILTAINCTIFDVTKGKRFYGPGGPYSSFAGHDASRALALFQTDMVKEDYDDLSDLTAQQMEFIKEWEEQLGEKYDIVGRLLKPGEEPSNYSEDEDCDQRTDEEKNKDD